MATEITIAGTAINYQDFEISVPTSQVDVAPSATLTTTAAETFAANDAVTITIDGTAVFEGRTRSAGTVTETGGRRVTVAHAARDFFEETVSISQTNPFVLDVLQAAQSNSNAGSQFTLSVPGTSVSLDNDYDVTDRSVKRVFRDMMDRTGWVWWVDPAGTTIHVEAPGGRGTWQAIDTQADRASLLKYDEGNVDTVRNAVTVVGTGDTQVRSTATDSTSITEYGRRPGNSPYNVGYVTAKSEASAIATELLVPNPLPSGKLLVGSNVGDVTQPLANYTVDITAPGKNVSATGLVVEQQTIEQGRATLQVGAGSGVSLAEVNRQSKSNDDVTDPGSVYGNDRLANDSVDSEQLVDTSVIEAKLADLAVTTQKLRNNAVINGKLADLSVSETKIQDDSISTPKLVAGAVTASKIEADTITASEIAAGTITSIEIAADTITGNNIAAGTISAEEIIAGTLTANEIAAGTLTANEIDTLDLDTNQLTIGQSGADGGRYFEFGIEASFTGDEAFMRPAADGSVSIGQSNYRFGGGNFVFVDVEDVFGENFAFGSGAGTRGTGGEGEIAPNNVAVKWVFDDDGGASPRMRADADGYGVLGASGNRLYEVHTLNLYEGSPEPLAAADPRGPPSAAVDAADGIDLDELLDSSWGDPPAYVQRRHTPDGEWEATDHEGREMGHVVNYVWEAAKDIERERRELEDRVEELEETVADLEQRLSKLEQQ